GDPLYGMDGKPKYSGPEYIDDRHLGCAEDGGYERPPNPVPGDCGYHLHAHRVVFPHPTTSEIIEITAPLPSPLRTLEE
ncbi:hypothetical protein M569_09992, partial [Genlisea aurea]